MKLKLHVLFVRVLVKMIYAVCIEKGATTFDAMDLISFT
jgi:hypothetical protein